MCRYATLLVIAVSVVTGQGCRGMTITIGHRASYSHSVCREVHVELYYVHWPMRSGTSNDYFTPESMSAPAENLNAAAAPWRILNCTERRRADVDLPRFTFLADESRHLDFECPLSSPQVRSLSATWAAVFSTTKYIREHRSGIASAGGWSVCSTDDVFEDVFNGRSTIVHNY